MVRCESQTGGEVTYHRSTFPLLEVAAVVAREAFWAAAVAPIAAAALAVALMAAVAYLRIRAASPPRPN